MIPLRFSTYYVCCLQVYFVFGSDRSSRCHNVCPSVCPSVRHNMLKSTQSASFWLRSSSNQSGISQQSVSTQRALREHSDVREHSESNQSIKIRVTTIGAYKYCVFLLLRLAVFGTKCIWDFWSLGQFTFFWDKYVLGQKVLGQIVSGTIFLLVICHWDNSPKSVLSLGKKVDWTFLSVSWMAVAYQFDYVHLDKSH